MKKRVEVRVDRLVLHGIQAGQTRFVREAVAKELASAGTRRETAAGRQLQIPEIPLPRGGSRS